MECSAALPTMATTMTPTKTSVRPSCSRAASTDPCTSNSLITATSVVATARTISAFETGQMSPSRVIVVIALPGVQILVCDE